MFVGNGLLVVLRGYFAQFWDPVLIIDIKAKVTTGFLKSTSPQEGMLIITTENNLLTRPTSMKLFSYLLAEPYTQIRLPTATPDIPTNRLGATFKP